MLPLLGLLKVRARDLIGYGLVYFLINFVLVLFLMWFFARTFPYVAPAIP
jgi:short-chain fatty acids transporter